MSDPVVNADEQRALREFAEPRWGYRMGENGEIEKKLFDTRLGAGWVDSPAKVNAAPEAAEPAPPADPTSPADTDNTTAPAPAPEAPTGGPATDPGSGLTKPYDQHKARVLGAELKRRTGKGPKVGQKKTETVDMLNALDAALEAADPVA